MDSAPTTIQGNKDYSNSKYYRSFQILSNKKNNYNIKVFTELNSIVINAKNINSNDIKSNEYENIISFEFLKKHKYFYICESISEISEELLNLIDNKKYSLTETEDNEIFLAFEVPMKKIKELKFVLCLKEKDLKTIVNELIQQNKELKSQIELLTISNKDLKDDIDYIKSKNDNNYENFSKLITEKVNNMELIINKKNVESNNEKNKLISQVNILTKKVLDLEKELEIERTNFKKILDKLNEIKLNKENNEPIKRVNTEQNQPFYSSKSQINENPPFHSSKSEYIPDIFEQIFGKVLIQNSGKKGKSKFHEHILIYSDYTMKAPQYAKANYYCDHCKEEFSKKVNNYHCKKCNYDLCDKCFSLGEIKI